MTFSEEIKEVIGHVRNHKKILDKHEAQKREIPARVSDIIIDITQELTESGWKFIPAVSSENVWYLILEEYEFHIDCAEIQSKFDANPKLDIRVEVESMIKAALKSSVSKATLVY